MAYIGTDLEDPLQIAAGATLTFESQTKPTGLIDSLDLDRTDDDHANICTILEAGMVMAPIIQSGVIPFSYGEELIFNRIWIDPTTINPDFIVEDTDYDIEIWNAWLTRGVTWTAENISGDTEGVYFDRDGLPISFVKSEAKIYTMTLYRTGPMIQDTTYTETIDGDDYDIDIDTMRILWLDPEPNWVQRVQTTYSFETVLAVSDRHFEQRRPLRHDIRRAASMEMMIADSHELHILSNVLQYGHDKVFAVPIFQERILCSAIPNGGTSITTTTDTTYHWNLNNACEQIMIADHCGGVIEIKEVDTVAANTITTTMAISETFNVNSTIVYPIFVGVLGSHSIRHETNTKAVVRVEFKEYIGG